MKVTVTRPEPVVPPAEYTITISEEAAHVIRAFLGGVGGSSLRPVDSKTVEELDELRDALAENLGGYPHKYRADTVYIMRTPGTEGLYK